MDSSTIKIRIERTGHPHFYSGYVFGYHSACISYQVRFTGDKCQHSIKIADFLKTKIETTIDDHPATEKSDLVRILIAWVGPLLKKAGHPVFESARRLNHSSLPTTEALIVQPCFKALPTLLVIDFLIDLMNEQSGNLALVQNYPLQWNEKFNNLTQKLTKTALQGFNPIHFISAAHELRIPWIHLGENLIQLGIGNKARWIDSSLTDKTPAISTKVARDKSATSELLKKAGVPVPPQFLVLNPDNAVKYAKSLGYPVVVKPANLDGGVGVKANLYGEIAVRQAFEQVRKVSDKIVIEKHVTGRDYRLQIVNGNVHGILERIPGGVTGNGKSTILELLIQQNNDRKNAKDDSRYLHPITKDDESSAQLSIQGLQWESIPQSGYFIRLRGAANVASGGIPLPLKIEDAHPDNLALAIRATRTLKLDVAGVDLLIPDIRKSWLKSGAYICEINAQPQMFTSMHKPMLSSLFVNENPRIPIIVHLTTHPQAYNGLAPQIHRQLHHQSIKSGLVNGNELWLGADCIGRDVENAFSGARMLTYDQATQAIVVGCQDTSFFQQGWPVDYCDALIIESLPATQEKGQPTPSISDWLIAAAALNIKVLIVPKLKRTETLDILKLWKKKPQTILCDFSNSKEIDHAIANTLTTLHIKSLTRSTPHTRSKSNLPRLVDPSSLEI